MEAPPEPGRVYWNTPIDECDVEDKDVLKFYRRKRAEWWDWLHGDDDHAICRQILLMNWSYLTYRVINESRRIAGERVCPSPALNGLIAEFNDLGFVATQALAVRRLTEREYDDPAKQVISLRRLVDDLKKHSDLFTREMFICFDGAPFDPEPGRKRWMEQNTRRLEEQGGVACRTEDYLTSGRDAWKHTERCHVEFDRFLDCLPQIRKRTDCIPTKIFDKLSKLLNDRAIQNARELCNKRIAHAADAVSRGQATQGISFKDIDVAHRAIVTVAQFVSARLLFGTTIAVVPAPQYNQFEYLNAGWLDEDGVRELSDLWKHLVDEREEWLKCGMMYANRSEAV